MLAPEGNAVILANPADKIIYYYVEGMSAPMGHFQNYRRVPRAVMVIDRSLRETQTGVYSAQVKLPASGKYDVSLLADSPRITHCFEAMAQPNPAHPKEKQIALKVDYQLRETNRSVGKGFPFRFKLIETATNDPRDKLQDVQVLTSLASGVWQRRDIAKSLGEGIYEVSLTLPESGVYLVFVESRSMRVQFRDLPYLTLNAIDKEMATAESDQSTAAKP